MIKSICFCCHGNICRSPMAEYIFRDMLKKAGLGKSCIVESRATSTEEIGNPVHSGTRRVLSSLGISCSDKRAIQLKASDYGKYDLIIGMDDANIRNITRITGGDPDGKVTKLLSYAGESGNIADPWYTGNFDETYRDVTAGCEGLLKYLF